VDQWGSLIFLAFPVLLLVLVVSRTRKQQREYAAIQGRASAGSEVMMASGVFGTVIDIDDDGIVTLEVAPGVHTRWTRQAIARVIDTDAGADLEPGAPPGGPVGPAPG
jgi:preprotein translocase subunit YajC